HRARGRDRDGVGEAGGVGAHGGGVGDRLDQAGDRGAHGEHAVGDHTGQPGLGGDGGVVVDGVEVAGGSGVAHQGVAADLVAGACELLADGEGGEVHGGGGGHVCSWVPGSREGGRGQAPRTISMLRTLATSAPDSSVMSTRVVIMEWPPAARTDSTVRVGIRRSPATTGRCRVNVSSPWTTRVKSMPASGSSMYCAS